MDEPTIPELIRDVQASLIRIESALVTYVTKEVHDLRHEALVQRVSDLEERDKSKGRLLWSALVLPVTVGIVLFLIQGVAK